MARRSYSEEERETALRLFVEVGPAEAGRRLGIPNKTVGTWARRAGLKVDLEKTASDTSAGTKAAALAWARRRPGMRDASGQAAEEFLIKARASTKGGEARAFATAFAICLDKAELLDGRATERVDVSESEARERVRQLRDELLRDELAAKRKARTDLAATG